MHGSGLINSFLNRRRLTEVTDVVSLTKECEGFFRLTKKPTWGLCYKIYLFSAGVRKI